jgi:hypothetical protein
MENTTNRVPLYIFDLDGTLALIDHRRHLVEAPLIPSSDSNVPHKDPKFKPDWDAFFAACIKDAPNWPVIGLMLQLRSTGADIRIWSGRMDTVRGATLEWLWVYTTIQPHLLDPILKLRPAGDYRPDEQLKKKWLNALSPEDRSRLGGVFDDRDKVVDMWRDNGVTCFQVARGDF